jgi:hypothetical protein
MNWYKIAQDSGFFSDGIIQAVRMSMERDLPEEKREDGEGYPYLIDITSFKKI